MENQHTFGVHFVIRQNRGKSGQAAVYLRITVNKTRCEVSLKCDVNAEEWNHDRGAARPKTENLKQLNSYLEEVRGRVVRHYLNLERKEQLVTATMVKSTYLGIAKDNRQYTLLWLVKEHNSQMQKVLEKGSLKNYFTTEKYLQNFLEKKFPAKDIYLKDLKYEFITAFEFFIRNCPIKANDPCTNNGTMKHLERLKKMVNWAEINEWIPLNPFTRYKLKFKHKERECLTEEELKKIELTEFAIPMLQRVKEMFVFSCYTGLSYIDLVALKSHQVITYSEGTKWLRTARTKNSQPVDVPLLKPALDILVSIQQISFPTKETVFYPISNQEVNRSLKIIAGICDIKRELTFHLARHTFATTITLMNGVPIESISKMLGHSKLSTTMIYARVTQSKIGMDMAKLQERLNSAGLK